MQRSRKGFKTSGGPISEEKAIYLVGGHVDSGIRHRKKCLHIKFLPENHVTFLYTSAAEA